MKFLENVYTIRIMLLTIDNLTNASLIPVVTTQPVTVTECKEIMVQYQIGNESMKQKIVPVKNW